MIADRFGESKSKAEFRQKGLAARPAPALKDTPSIDNGVETHKHGIHALENILILKNFFKRKPPTNSETSQSSDAIRRPAVPGAPSPGRLIGLHVLHESKTGTGIVNIVFVHGLGGSATETWTHEPSKIFWPTLLHEDDRFANIRISTFGYDADFNNVFAAKNVLGIPDFAKQLLDDLDLHYDKYGDVNVADIPQLI